MPLTNISAVQSVGDWAPLSPLRRGDTNHGWCFVNKATNKRRRKDGKKDS